MYCQRGKQTLDAGCPCQEFQEIGAKAKGLSREKYFRVNPCLYLKIKGTTRQVSFSFLLPHWPRDVLPWGMCLSRASSAKFVGISSDVLPTMCFPAIWPPCGLVASNP